MKEFEKWWNKLVHIAPEDKKILEWGWEAALERVLKHTKQTNRGRIGIIDWIEQELEESK